MVRRNEVRGSVRFLLTKNDPFLLLLFEPSWISHYSLKREKPPTFLVSHVGVNDLEMEKELFGIRFNRCYVTFLSCWVRDALDKEIF
uniref:SFRICE_002884 n=1 Tax=Spodoptera frugiperda TaxID=7108 RepID=A0A2H1VND7_SPOFR